MVDAHSVLVEGALPPVAADEDVVAVPAAPAPCVIVPPALPPEDRDDVPPVAAPFDVCAEPVTGSGAASVRAGTSSGSLPQDDDVVMPPVALSETEHGIPCSISTGLVGAVSPDVAPGVMEEGDAGDAPCAKAGPDAASQIAAGKMNKGFMESSRSRTAGHRETFRLQP